MPAAIRSLPPPSKRRKQNPSSSSSSSLASRIKSLESTLTNAVQSSASLNLLADLLDLALTATEPSEVSKALYALYRVFVLLLGSGKLTTASGDDEGAKTVRAWLWERLGGYQDLLVGLMKDGDTGLRISALQILFSLQKHLSSSVSSSSQPQFHVSHFKKVVQGLLVCPPSPRMGSTSSNDGSGKGELEPEVRECFVDTWLSVHDDVRWFFLRESVPILRTSTNPHTPANLLSILERLTIFPTEQSEINSWWVSELGAKPKAVKKSRTIVGSLEDSEEENEEIGGDGGQDDDWRKFFDEPVASSAGSKTKPQARLHKLTVHQSLHSLASHRAVFTRAWLALLPLLSFSIGTDGTENGGRNQGRENGEGRKLTLRALNVMHRCVMPHLTRAVLVMDWVGGCVDYGGTVGLLGLNALFVLMTEYNLDYPSFYTRLYAFLDRDVLHSKHRARFFRLTELFLGSTHLPANLLASFIKKLSRLSLNAPPAAIVMVIPFTYNVLKRHPALMVMIHRVPEGDEDVACVDSFRLEEPNPNLTDALDSSLWELYSHKRHYHAGVSTLARVFEEAFTKPGYGMEDFLDHGYGTLLDTEVKRKIMKEPVLAMEMRGDVFPVGSTSDEEPEASDMVSDLWCFS